MDFEVYFVFFLILCGVKNLNYVLSCKTNERFFMQWGLGVLPLLKKLGKEKRYIAVP